MELIHIANATFSSLRKNHHLSLENLASKQKLFRIVKEQTMRSLASPADHTTNRAITPAHVGIPTVRVSSHELASSRASRLRGARAGGASRDRTGDLLVANQALSQLSYGPSPNPGGSGRSCTSDLTLIRGAL